MIQDIKDLLIGALLMMVVCGGPLFGIITLLHFIFTGQP
jgi:hypothetical protein